MNSYCVYRHIAPNGKMYVGITCQQPKNRWKNGNGYQNQPYFFNAIQKYGWDNFKHEVLLDGLSVKEATLAEQIFIHYWKLSEHDNGYNIESGGLNNYVVSDETRLKRSMSMLGKHAGDKNPMYGKHLTEEQKHKISVANTGRVRSDEVRRKMSANRPKKTVLQLDKDTHEIINMFESTHDAYRKTGIGQNCICRCCNNKAKTAGGYCWQYYQENKNQERRNVS